MSNKKKSRTSKANQSEHTTIVPAQPTVSIPAESSEQEGAPSANLGLYIALIGIVLVLGAGGIFVWLNRASTPSGPPRLASNWLAGPVNLCRGSPRFPLKLGFDRSVVFDTSESLLKGLELVEPGPNGDLTSGKRYQDPTWTMAGYLGVFVVDHDGNVYVVPNPHVSLLDNPPDKANIIYKIDSDTGKMSEYINLPSATPPTSENPYGALALTYDCDTNSLYVTTVMGSTHANEVGRIYRVDLKTGKVAAEYDNVDGFGIAVFNHPTGKRLYFGSARTPVIRSIALDAQGNFWGEPRDEIILTGAYNRPRRIDFSAQGQMLVRGVDFDYTLSATSEQRRTDYAFQYDDANAKWVQVSP